MTPTPDQSLDDQPARRPLRLELRGIRKAYPAVVANDGVDLAVAPGEIHAVVGENGAGKSTLMKIIYGMVRPDAGEMLWEGREAEVRSPVDAQRLGIGMVFQHFALFETLTVAENIALATPGRPAIADLAPRIAELATRYGLPVDPMRRVHSMSVGERQRVEIIRALLQSPRLLIMDEPTSVLTPQAVRRLFETLRQLAAEGCSILYISHKLDEIRELCERATILRGGKVVGICDPRAETPASLARAMIGAELPGFRDAAARSPGAMRLTVTNLSKPADGPFGTALGGISLGVRAGEILGIAGVSGNGQKELLAALSGEARSADATTVAIDGAPAGHLAPAARRRLGLAYVPEDRQGQGAIPVLTLSENALLTAARQGLTRHGLVQFGKLRAYAERCISSFDVRCGGPDAAAGSLSGGNLQKFIVGREVLQEPGVLVVAQPTWGVDVGAAVAIRQALIDRAAAGAAVLVVSEELDELFEIADRIAVIAGGRLSPAYPARLVDRDAIGLAMTGTFPPVPGDAAPVPHPPTPEAAHAAAP
ncbi:ABC transporter ATP-binding protein [Methylobrevis albus]|uniref:ABC transporter ATP-binding protein n=1 Tax=Methylobrevis albus TaxID=2793297 RepID=A0A931HYX5_9HYPH|nr:ABC transporter ATP-binding protein [Methylobrevis albus]MBH0236622.1 ABC transporter ATP-binding protein [Methylobrevis albus]